MNGEEIPLPELHDAILDAASVDELFTYVASEGREVEVRVKGGAEARSSDEPLTLAEARDALLRGHAVGVQLRYMRRGELWCDTLMRTDAGTRLVRMKQPWGR